MHPPIFTLHAPTSPWGDYGDILTHGLTILPRDDRGRLQLERTGPFVPPLSFPVMHMLVTGACREKLAASGLTGLVFTPVVLARIVRLEWEKWDKSAPHPKRYPLGGEPENYILLGKHRPELAEQIGPMFELSPPDNVRLIKCGTERKFGMDDWPILRPSRGSWRGDDVFANERRTQVLVTARARAWFERELGEWVRFEEEQWAD